MHELTQFQAQAANLALHKMLHGTHFSICDLDKLAKLIGVPLGGGLQPKQKVGGLAEAVKMARGGDAPIPFKRW